MSNEKPVNPSSPTPTEGLKRKRGRPKKQPEEEDVGPLPEKKPRGRPKGSKKVTTGSGQMVEPPAAKRPRGRPRKQPQVVVQDGASHGENPQGSSDSNLNSVPATQGQKMRQEANLEYTNNITTELLLMLPTTCTRGGRLPGQSCRNLLLPCLLHQAPTLPEEFPCFSHLLQS
ncbi:AAC-rich mRNA clone AAC11 protein-like [Pogoniulus pusillus]|uniref:AAC-rich mRNA clone AAC11 protein-like n=1 Tax=Pogoniulus pusillus TaxID=488313 RepID=UPI0030B91E5D